MALSTGAKIGIGVGAAALAVIALVVLSTKSAEAALPPKKQPGVSLPPGTQVPPGTDLTPVPVNQNGGVQLASGNMGTLMVVPAGSSPPGVDVYVPNDVTDKLVSMTSSNEAVVPVANIVGYAASSLAVISKGITTLTFVWTSGTTTKTTTFLAVYQ